jgi:hypothetical protein
MQPAAKQFLLKIAVLTILFYGISLLVSTVWDRSIDWRSRQDPHQRLLWDSDTAQAQIILLGDSVLVSSFVNSADDTLPAILERKTGKRVFDGSLTGADPADFLNGAKVLEKNATRGSDVIVDVMPARFFKKKHPDPAAGNYPGQFAKLVGNNALNEGFVTLIKPLVILHPEIFLNFVFPRKWYATGEYRDRVWYRDGDLARKRFEGFDKEVVDSDSKNNFGWILDLDAVLKRSDNKLIIFITPFNSWLIKQYTNNQRAEKFLNRFEKKRKELISYLGHNGIDFIDGSGRGSSEDFVDMIHPNASGVVHLAEAVAAYLGAEETPDRIAANRGRSDLHTPGTSRTAP